MVQKAAVARPSIQIWADVGGTFTDCFVDDGNARRSTKVLSNGLIRCRSIQLDSDSYRVDIPDDHRIDGFFDGCSVRRLMPGREPTPLGRITHFRGDDAIVQVDRLSDSNAGHSCSDAGDVLLEIDSGVESPVLAAKLLLGVPLASPMPRTSVRLGTTRGTNALLTRSGVRTGLVTTEGFADLLKIGEQDRPDLFALNIHKPEPLPAQSIEVNERLDHAGTVLTPIDRESLRRQLGELKGQGIESIAICFLHAHVNDEHEVIAEKLAREVGFDDISRSSEVAPLIKVVARAETTVLDAYLNPILRRYLQRLEQQFGGREVCRLSIMTSAGNLVSTDHYRGRDSVLSGPAGGVVALARMAESLGRDSAIGLDMGGTSTDVSRFDGRVARRQESKVSGIRILTPMMDIHTVAAGGGSICDDRSGRLVVGPESAGSDPGPACYGRGGPLTVTDVNLLLGRIPESRFPFPLDRAAAEARLQEIIERRCERGLPRLEPTALAAGYVKIACTHMAEAVRTVTTAQGSDPRSMSLVGFGGAAGQHLCEVATLLGMSHIVDHPDASLLSALGMGLAAIGHVATQGVYKPLDQVDNDHLIRMTGELKSQCVGRVKQDVDADLDSDRLRLHYEFDCRYVGADAFLTLTSPIDDVDFDLADRFHRMHHDAFGYRRDQRAIELVAVRCEAQWMPATSLFDAPDVKNESAPSRPPETRQVWADGRWTDYRTYERSQLRSGMRISAPAMVVSDHSTLLIQEGWQAVVGAGGLIELHRVEAGKQSQDQDDASEMSDSGSEDDPVQLEVIARRLQGIADSMGEVLRRTAISVNVKERRDYSCAVFRGDGALIANAPHVPVHLGAMGHTVRHLMRVYPAMSSGDCYVSNDPFQGGSHLPDVTVVTPVFCRKNVSPGTPDFFVASRAHHAEIGGLTPGSMPPLAGCLADEGVVIRQFALARHGVDATDDLLKLLRSGRYPSRNPDENLADIDAQRAAGGHGAKELTALAAEASPETVRTMMTRLIQSAGDTLSSWLQGVLETPHEFVDELDDGTRISVRLSKQADMSTGIGRLTIDFSGTAGVHPHGFNATPAIVTAAVMYGLRVASGGNLPLCDGLLRDVDIVLPPGLLDPPADPDPAKCPAVVAGNVETSQRIVDVLLGALGIAAASQGTMNNLLIGDSTFGYYETIGGGSGATASAPGASGVHTHMTNTRITDPEVLESRLPCRLLRFEIRRGSGGEGQQRGGDGLIREMEFLRPLTVSLITGRRTTKPYGQNGGGFGAPGKNILVRSETESSVALPFATTIDVAAGDRLRIETPGGGGWGSNS